MVDTTTVRSTELTVSYELAWLPHVAVAQRNVLSSEFIYLFINQPVLLPHYSHPHPYPPNSTSLHLFAS